MELSNLYKYVIKVLPLIFTFPSSDMCWIDWCYKYHQCKGNNDFSRRQIKSLVVFEEMKPSLSWENVYSFLLYLYHEWISSRDRFVHLPCLVKCPLSNIPLLRMLNTCRSVTVTLRYWTKVSNSMQLCSFTHFSLQIAQTSQKII